MKLLTLTAWAVALSAFFATVILPATALPSGGGAATIGAHGLDSTSRRSMALQAALTGNSGDPVLCKCCIDHNSNYCCGGGHCCNNACATLELEDRTLDEAMPAELAPVAAARAVAEIEAKAEPTERNTFKPYPALGAVLRATPGNEIEARGDPNLCACCNNHGAVCCGTGLQTCCNTACDGISMEARDLGQAKAAELGPVAAARTIAQIEAKAEHVERKGDDVEALERHTLKPYQASTSGVKRGPVPGTTPRGHGIDATSRRSFPGEKDITLRGQDDIEAAARDQHSDLCACCINHGYMYCCGNAPACCFSCSGFEEMARTLGAST